MPIHLGKDSKGPFVQWGHQKKYHYKANDKQSLANAKSRAKKQMKAIFSSGYISQDVQNIIPQYLYHATYGPLLRKIKQLGLGNTKRTYWQDSKPGVVYLADDPDVAESYAECNENLRNEDWLDQIIVFRINTQFLDKSKLFVDQNVKLDEGQTNATWQYHGIIPYQNLELVTQNIYQSKFDKLFNLILQSLDENVKYFETFDDAKDFFNKNYDGHCIIYSNDGKLLETCRCITFIHDKLNLPKAIINMSEQVYKQQQRKKFKDDTFYSKFFNKGDINEI